MNGALLAPTGYKVDEDNIVSFQMSPDYTGSPFFPMDCELGYSLAPLCLRPWPCRCALKTTVGGGMVETFAFGGTAPEGGVPGTQGKLPVGAPSKPFSLTTAVAISSFAPAVFAAYSYFTACTFNIHGQYWPVAGGKRPAGAKAREFQFGDGGNLDNSGLLPLLQRQAKNVIWIASSSDPLSQTYDFENATQHDFDPVVAGVVGQLYSAFGYAQNLTCTEVLDSLGVLISVRADVFDAKERSMGLLLRQQPSLQEVCALGCCPEACKAQSRGQAFRDQGEAGGRVVPATPHAIWVLRKLGTPIIDPQIVGFLCNKIQHP